MNFKKIAISFFLFITFLFLIKVNIFAIEGEAELNSTIGQNSRCYAVSIFMPDNRYHVSLTCRNLVYPPQADVLNYVLWGSVADNDRPINLGFLGVGKLEATTDKNIASFFVTPENNLETRQPSGNIIMRGSIIPFNEFEDIQAPPVEKGIEENVAASTTPTPIPTEGRLQSLLKGLTFLPLAGLVVLVVFLLVLIRRKG